MTQMVNSAFDAVRQQEGRYKKPYAERDVSLNHYYWFGAEDIPVHGLPSNKIERCRVTPVTRKLTWDAIELILEEQREPGYLSDPDPISRRPTMAAYATAPGYIAEHLEECYGLTNDPERLRTGIRGVIEFEHLRGWNIDDVEALNIDGLFFPEIKDGERIDETPKTYRELRERIRDVKSKVASGDIMVDPKHKNALVKCADLMLQSLQVSEMNDQLVLDGTHASMERAKSDKNEKANYDARDFRALRRLEQARRDEAISKLASEHNTLHDVVTDLIKTQVASQAATKEGMADFAKAIADAFKGASEKPEEAPKPKK